MTRRDQPTIPRRDPASDRLTGALLDLAAQGLRPPCGEYGAAALWTSDDYHDRRLAAVWCEPCPIKQVCHEAAEANQERHGVWGGIDRTATSRARAPGKQVLGDPTEKSNLLRGASEKPDLTLRDPATSSNQELTA